MKKIRITLYLLLGAISTIIWFGLVMHQTTPEYQSLIIGDRVFSQEIGVVVWFILVGIIGVFAQLFENKFFEKTANLEMRNVIGWFVGFPVASFLVMIPLMIFNIDVMIGDLFK